MGKVKGTAMDEIRNMMHEFDAQKEEALKALLTPEEKKAYESIMPISWFDIEILTEIGSKAAQVLFPKDPDGVLKMGAYAAKFSLSTVYKIFLRILSVPQVLKQAAKIWKTYHAQGRAEVKPIPGKTNTVHFIVYDYPDLTKKYFPMMAAYMRGTMLLAGAKSIQIVIQDENPEAWIFVVSWK